MTSTLQFRALCSAIVAIWAGLELVTTWNQSATPIVAVAIIFGCYAIFAMYKYENARNARICAFINLLLGSIAVGTTFSIPSSGSFMDGALILLWSIALIAQSYQHENTFRFAIHTAFLLTVFELFADAAGLALPSFQNHSLQVELPAAIGLFGLMLSSLPDDDLFIRPQTPDHKWTSFRMLVFSALSVSLIFVGLRELSLNFGAEKVLLSSVLPVAFIQLLIAGALYNKTLRLQLRETAQNRRRLSMIRYGAKLQMLYERAPLGFIEVDGGNINDANEFACSWLGMRANELIGKPFHAILTPISAQYFDRHANMVSHHGWFENVELQLIAKDGTTIPVVASVGPAGTKTKNRTLIIFREPSANKERVDLLQLIEDHYLLLVDSVDEYAVAALDADGKIVEWSSRAEQIFGISRFEAYEMRLAYLYTGPQGNSGLLEATLQAAKTRGRQTHEAFMQSKTGNRIKVRLTVEAIQRDAVTSTGFLIVIKVLSPDSVPPTANSQKNNLRFLEVVDDEDERQEIGAFFNEQAAVLLDELMPTLTEKDVRAAEESCRKLEKLLNCVGCESMSGMHSQLQCYVRHHDWSAAQQAVAAMHAILDHIHVKS